MLKPKTYSLLCRAVEEGVERGWMKFWKHREATSLIPEEGPDAVMAKDVLCDAVLEQIMEDFEIPEDSE